MCILLLPKNILLGILFGIQATHQRTNTVIQVDTTLRCTDFLDDFPRFWEISAGKISSIEKSCKNRGESAVFTVDGRYTSRGWTDWTEGFRFGSAILQFDATGNEEFLRIGKRAVRERMITHLTHFGVHDHGFNNVSTFGNLHRLVNEGICDAAEWEGAFYEQALRVSGTVQTNRWTTLPDDRGFIHSFNGPHSLFADTIRTLRSLAIAHSLGQFHYGEQDEKVSLLKRLIQHAQTTAQYIVYYGEGRDAYDVRGRVAHEAIFNTRNGSFRCPSSQQGYSPFSTWTRGLAWIVLGYAELLEWIDTVDDAAFDFGISKESCRVFMEKACAAAQDFYRANTPADGIPYWDTGAPKLSSIENHRDTPADPANTCEPVDSSAAAIAAQGLLRFGRYRSQRTGTNAGAPYYGAGLTILKRLLSRTYLCDDPEHQGLLLHSIYHRPNNWDAIPRRGHVPHGESCMWGDYHLRELVLYVQRIATKKPYYCFFTGVTNT